MDKSLHIEAFFLIYSYKGYVGIIYTASLDGMSLALASNIEQRLSRCFLLPAPVETLLRNVRAASMRPALPIGAKQGPIILA